MTPLRVLITNDTLATRTGTALFTRDLALGLRGAGHVPAVYSPEPGPVAEEIRAAGIDVASGVDRLGDPPDVIHGQHSVPAMEALLRFPRARMVFVVHHPFRWMDAPPRHPRIRRYVAVDGPCRERIVGEAGLPPEATSVIHDAVDLERFPWRFRLPPRPERALVLGPHGTGETMRAVVQEACARAGIALDVPGPSGPGLEEVLGGYDLVFAKSRCALEALAVGCAVILCGEDGVGGLVTPEAFERMRSLGFGDRALVRSVTAAALGEEIGRYDPSPCGDVSRRAREEAALPRQIAQWVALYQSMLAEPDSPADPDGESRAVREFLRTALPRAREWDEHLEEIRSLRALSATVRADAAEARGLRAENAGLRSEREVLAAELRDLRGSAAFRLRAGLGGLLALGRPVRRLTRWAARLRQRTNAAGGSSPTPPPFPVIVGVARSGTTLLRLMLDAHTQLSIPPETGWLVEASALPESGWAARDALFRLIRSAPSWPDFHLEPAALAAALAGCEPFTRTAGVQAFYRLYGARFGKPRGGDATPGYLLQMEAVERAVPEARFVHVIRDGRDVALSLRGLGCAPGRSMQDLARDWCRRVHAGRSQGARAGQYLEVRFEDLVTSPVAALRRVAAFLDLPYEAGLERYHLRSGERLQELEEQRDRDGRLLATKEQRRESMAGEPLDRSRVSAWKTGMSEEDRRAFEEVAAPTLRELGYEVEKR